ncbi:MAG: PhnD/SsuA/transferrin family substrate-binding protein [Deltaproteobacteria bacterium]|nr:PhnD/SsuA/transferrin family substrate-binding protein [Deltaproteobacteria bacterium]MCW5808681.1 PhnD/SsuA/transferrin family substrate-binding protein [Deltaproteobacteria bacterium]
MKRGWFVVFVSVLVLAMPATARAETTTVGLFAPSAPFPSTAARVELATRLGEHVGKALGGTGVGRVYARSGDFAAAVKKGEVTVALVDATYLASSGGYTIIAASLRGGASAQPWQLVARGASKIGDLRGKRVLVPASGGSESLLALNVFLGGDVPKDFFAKIEVASDTAAAIAAVGMGNADAAFVPSGADLPGGVTAVLALPAIAGPMLVAYGTVTRERRTALEAAALSFKGDATVSGFRGDAGGLGTITGRFTIAPKIGPFSVAAVRLVVGELAEGRAFAIERTPVTTFTAAPVIRAAPDK